jgi:hypothetical protein
MRFDKEYNVAPENDKDTQLHVDPIVCFGCKREFSLTLRDDPYEYTKKYCATCFGYVFSLKSYKEVRDKLSPLHKILWETPTEELPPNIKALVSKPTQQTNNVITDK